MKDENNNDDDDAGREQERQPIVPLAIIASSNELQQGLGGSTNILQIGEKVVELPVQQDRLRFCDGLSVTATALWETKDMPFTEAFSSFFFYSKDPRFNFRVILSEFVAFGLLIASIIESLESFDELPVIVLSVALLIEICQIPYTYRFWNIELAEYKYARTLFRLVDIDSNGCLDREEARILSQTGKFLFPEGKKEKLSFHELTLKHRTVEYGHFRAAILSLLSNFLSLSGSILSVNERKASSDNQDVVINGAELNVSVLNAVLGIWSAIILAYVLNKLALTYNALYTKSTCVGVTNKILIHTCTIPILFSAVVFYCIMAFTPSLKRSFPDKQCFFCGESMVEQHTIGLICTVGVLICGCICFMAFFLLYFECCVLYGCMKRKRHQNAYIQQVNAPVIDTKAHINKYTPKHAKAITGFDTNSNQGGGGPRLSQFGKTNQGVSLMSSTFAP